ncbi:MAG: sulfurtransferase [Acidobacteria bacterium]|nr:sulfurtransferase [Acidobacteriota bacterium]MCI0626465.1 sulfurtransferase [Acidobacteriota bacterium]MCI0724235.1 sulfurtransferase [Acidobacteriota bacterium]
MSLCALSRAHGFRLSRPIVFIWLVLISPFDSYFETRPALPKSEWLVEVSWLNKHLKDRIIIADTRTEQEHMQGHIPGAVWLDLSGVGARTSESALPLMHQELASKFSTLGITGAEQVVFYDESMGTKAPKALWFLTYAGYRWGRVLHGGFGAWEKAGLPVSTERLVRPPRTFNVNANPAILASTDYVAKRLRSTTVVILDVRSRDEYAGKNASKHCARNGRIPGAVWLEWTQLLESPLSYLQIANLQKRLTDAGVTPDKEILVYCHQGNRASNSYLALQLLGYARVRNYVGSWHEWAARLDLPMEKDE